jgi:hypothetical protein
MDTLLSFSKDYERQKGGVVLWRFKGLMCVWFVHFKFQALQNSWGQNSGGDPNRNVVKKFQTSFQNLAYYFHCKREYAIEHFCYFDFLVCVKFPTKL